MSTAAWLDRTEYPFASHYLELPAARLHYVDEGEGEPILMVHGQPTGSFMYREAIRGLAPHFRCIAVDLLGFGLSDKPEQWSYRPEEHASHIGVLVDHLELDRTHLLVHNWGGPIGRFRAPRRESVGRFRKGRAREALGAGLHRPLHGFPRLPTQVLGRRLLGLYNEYVKVWVARVGHQTASTGAAFCPDSCDDHLDIRQVLDNLDRVGADLGDQLLIGGRCEAAALTAAYETCRSGNEPPASRRASASAHSCRRNFR